MANLPKLRTCTLNKIYYGKNMRKAKTKGNSTIKNLRPFPIVKEVCFHCRMCWGEWIAALVARDRWHRNLPADNVGASCPERVVDGKNKEGEL